MKQVVRGSVAPNILEGRAMTLKVLKARSALAQNGRRIARVWPKPVRGNRGSTWQGS
jgi:hypothetical protein